MIANRAHLLCLLLVLAQALLAWHSPSHLVEEDHSGTRIVQVPDCDLCSPGQGLAAAPTLELAAPAPRARTAVPVIVPGHSQSAIPGAGARAPPLLS